MSGAFLQEVSCELAVGTTQVHAAQVGGEYRQCATARMMRSVVVLSYFRNLNCQQRHSHSCRLEGSIPKHLVSHTRPVVVIVLPAAASSTRARCIVVTHRVLILLLGFYSVDLIHFRQVPHTHRAILRTSHEYLGRSRYQRNSLQSRFEINEWSVRNRENISMRATIRDVTAPSWLAMSLPG